MPTFRLFGKPVSHADFEQLAEIEQISTTVPVETILSLLASRWLDKNGDGVVELRNTTGTVLIRLTQPFPPP